MREEEKRERWMGERHVDGGEAYHVLTTSFGSGRLLDMSMGRRKSCLEDSLFGSSFEMAPEKLSQRLQIEMVALSYGRRFMGEANSMYILEIKACILWIINENGQLLFLF